MQRPLRWRGRRPCRRTRTDQGQPPAGDIRGGQPAPARRQRIFDPDVLTMEHFFALTFGAEEQAHQRRKGSYDRYEHTRSAAPEPTGLGAAEAEFLQRRDSFYIASTGSNGWPYVQHRGGIP